MRWNRLFILVIALASISVIPFSHAQPYEQPYSISAYSQGNVYTITVNALNPAYYNKTATLLIVDQNTGATLLSKQFVNSTTVIQTITSPAIVEVTVGSTNNILAYQQITPYVPPQPAQVGEMDLGVAVGIIFAGNLGIMYVLYMALKRRLIYEKSKATNTYSKDYSGADVLESITLAENIVNNPVKKEALLFWLDEFKKRGLSLEDLKKKEGGKNGN